MNIPDTIRNAMLFSTLVVGNAPGARRQKAVTQPIGPVEADGTVAQRLYAGVLARRKRGISEYEIYVWVVGMLRNLAAVDAANRAQGVAP